MRKIVLTRLKEQPGKDDKLPLTLARSRTHRNGVVALHYTLPA